MGDFFIIIFILSIILLAASAVKWALPFKKYSIIILVSTIISTLLTFLISQLGLSEFIIYLVFLVLQVVIYAGIIALLFFRDPKRNVPTQPGIMVSPADGTVIYINKVAAGSILSSEKKGKILIYDELKNSSLANKELWQIGISLLFTDVHINRAPIRGKVAILNHRPGKFLSLRHKDAVNVNERNTIVIENDEIKIGLVQIASRLVRRIESYIKLDEYLEIGQKIGMIKFGSQVDLFIPVEKIKQINVDVGDYIVAGESIIAKLN